MCTGRHKFLIMPSFCALERWTQFYHLHLVRHQFNGYSRIKLGANGTGSNREQFLWNVLVSIS
jgi:hypothetical protein